MEHLVCRMTSNEQLDMLFAVILKVRGNPEDLLLSRPQKRHMARKFAALAKGGGR